MIVDQIKKAIVEIQVKISITSNERITLVAVSKQQPDERIDAALAAGHRVFGENRVQEAISRWAHRRADYPDLTLHLIGPLQTNKAADAVALFDVIEVVDREKLAAALAKEMTKQNRHLPCLVQVNTGEEEQLPHNCVAIDSTIAGNVWQILVKQGDRVEAGQPLVILESMKMEIEITSPAAGSVYAINRSEGSQVNSGQALLILQEDN